MTQIVPAPLWLPRVPAAGITGLLTQIADPPAAPFTHGTASSAPLYHSSWEQALFQLQQFKQMIREEKVSCAQLFHREGVMSIQTTGFQPPVCDVIRGNPPRSPGPMH